MATGKPPPIQRDWASKTLAGALLGFTLAIGCSGLFSRLNPDMALTAKAQLAMWMVAPMWLGTLSASYFFRSGWRAWFWLGSANLLAFAALALLRLF